MSVSINNHAHLSELQAKVQSDLGVGYVRLDWMPEGEPFEIKQFVLNTLSKMHYQLCLQHIHDMQEWSGGAQCRYCSWGWGWRSATMKAEATEPGIEV